MPASGVQAPLIGPHAPLTGPRPPMGNHGSATGCYAQITSTPDSNKIIGNHIKLTLISNLSVVHLPI